MSSAMKKQIPLSRCGNLFFHHKTISMKYYILVKENEMHIVLVTTEKQDAFLGRYGQKVLTSTETLWDALTKLEGIPTIICDGF